MRKNIAALEPYSTARDEYKGELGILLDANENPYDSGVNRYPSTALKEKVRGLVAELQGVAPEKLFLGNGSDEAIDLCYRIFCTPGQDKAIMIAPSYGMYKVCADINDVEAVQIQLNEDFSLPSQAILAAADERCKLLFVCSPNNPTGNAFSASEIEDLVQNFGGMMVVDEAYIDFADSCGTASLTEKYSNLIVLRTLSKAYGLAGLRIGIAISNPYVISLMKRVKYPYNIGTDTLNLAVELLATDVSPQMRTIVSEREKVAAQLLSCPCVMKVYPSQANFLLVRVTNPRGLYDRLIEGGLIVRDRSRVKGCEGCLRITIGTPEENVKLMEIISSYES